MAARTWWKFSPDMCKSPEAEELARVLELPNFAAAGAVALLYVWAIGKATDDGNINEYTTKAIETACMWEGKRGELLQAFHASGVIIGDIHDRDDDDPLRIANWADVAADILNERQRTRTRRTQNPDLNMVQRKEHALMGLVSELGEVCAHYQKVYQGHPMDADAVIKELGDMMWFMAELCDVLRIDMESVAKRNIAKLEGRYPDGFEKNRSLNRETEKPKGFALKCYGDPHECGYCMGNADNPDAWCTMFDRPCGDVHIDAYLEDGEE